MNEIEFLVAMLKDLENHVNIIERRIKKLKKET